VPILPDGEGRDKWEGGVVGNDGCLYGMPQRAKNVLKIQPATPRNSERVGLLICLVVGAISVVGAAKLAKQ
jgi:hypothetical protein